jgi:DNA-binding transcriptional ArsR family regulator
MGTRPTKPLTAEQRAKVFKALSDPRRVEIVDALAKDGSLCGTQLAEQLGVSIALLCHHWDVLIDAGLVKKQRVGQLRMCTLDSERLREATAWAGAPEKPQPRSKRKAKPAKRAAAR